MYLLCSRPKSLNSQSWDSESQSGDPFLWVSQSSTSAFPYGSVEVVSKLWGGVRPRGASPIILVWELTRCHWGAQKGAALHCPESRRHSSSQCPLGSPRVPRRSHCGPSAAAAWEPPAASSHNRWRSGSHGPGSGCCTIWSNTNCPVVGPEQTKPQAGLSLTQPHPDLYS